MGKNILDNAKKLFLKMIETEGKDYYGLVNHIAELKKWADKMCKKYPEADKNVILLAVYLHDIGHYPINPEEDHAITGEKIARMFLTSQNVESDLLERVCHCVRSHRCKDVQPQTLEAKIMACIDSASHFTDVDMYPSMIKQGKLEYALGKVERDYRDIGLFPEVQEELKGLYVAWKRLIEEFARLGN